MTTAGEAVVGRGVTIAGEATVGGIDAGTGVVVVPGGPSGVTRHEFDDLAEHVDDVEQDLAELAARPRDYPHTQQAPAAVWQVPHGLGFRPTFTAFDTDGRPIAHGGHITHPVPGEVLEVHWGLPFAGSGYAS